MKTLVTFVLVVLMGVFAYKFYTGMATSDVHKLSHSITDIGR
jgi:hypothetical protein